MPSGRPFPIRIPAACALAAILALAAGCGESVSDLRASVEGTVTLDGQPLADGRIKFVPTGDTKGPVSGGSIRDGVYKIPAEKGVAIGTNKVEINSTKTTGRKFQSAESGKMVDETAEAIPDKYNSRTTLEETIGKGVNTIDFPLTSE